MDTPEHDETAEASGTDTTETHESVQVARASAHRTAPEIPGLVGYALVVGAGPRQGLYWELPDGTSEAGRNATAFLLLDDVSVSRHHAEFEVTGDELTVRDLGSTNGTYVNATRVDETKLEPGDEVIVGRFHLLVAKGS